MKGKSILLIEPAHDARTFVKPFFYQYFFLTETAGEGPYLSFFLYIHMKKNMYKAFLLQTLNT
jgi:cephalosporin-C deacetylase-like acetyl esterase